MIGFKALFLALLATTAIATPGAGLEERAGDSVSNTTSLLESKPQISYSVP